MPTVFHLQDEYKERVLAVETIMHSVFKSKETSYDVIDFDTPVNVSEVKFIPPSMFLSTPSGGFVLGATTPEKFSINFFVNNINNPNCTTYENLGSLDYDETKTEQMEFKCSTETWSNKLILSGKFLRITVIVFGTTLNPNAEIVQKDDETIVPIIQHGGARPRRVVVNNDNVIEPGMSSNFSNLKLEPDSQI